MKQRRDTAANMSAVVLHSGELAFYTDTKKLYVGDGTTAGGILVTGFANPMTTAGDLMYGGVSGLPTRRAKGTNGQVLTMVADVPAWAANAALVNPMDDVGQMIYGGSGGEAEVLEPGDEDDWMRMQDGIPTWVPFSPLPNVLTGPGSLIVGGSGGEPQELEVTSDEAPDMVLMLDSDLMPYWGTIAAGGGTWGTIGGTLADQTDLAAAISARATAAAPSFTGIMTSTGANVTTANAMGALAIDVTKGLNTKSIAADSTFTFSGAPATANTWFSCAIKNTDGDDVVATIPSSKSLVRGEAITTVTVPAGSIVHLTWRYDGTDYWVYGDPTETASGGLPEVESGDLAGYGLLLDSDLNPYWGPIAGGGGGASVSIGTSAPGSPEAGDLWWHSEEGVLKIYYDDGDTEQWVDASPSASAPSGGTDYILIRDQKASNTAGGNFSSGAWQTRTLNTEVHDTGGHASIASNQITLAAGTYRARIMAPAFLVDRHQAKLYNITDSADVLIGTSEFSSSGSGTSSHSVIMGRFTIAAAKVLEVQHQCGTSNAAGNGFGVAAGGAFTVTNEVYTIVELEREA